MKKIAILMVLALAACGEKTASISPVSTPSVLDMLHNDALLDSSFKACQDNGGFQKAERSLLCANAMRANVVRSETRSGTTCSLHFKNGTAELKACFDKEYDKRIKN